MISLPGVLAAAPVLNGSSHPLPANESYALQMAQANTGFATAGYSYITATGISETLLSSAGALIVTIEVPWDRYGQWQTESHFVLGNDWRGVPLAGGLSLAVVGPQEKSASRQIVFRASNDALQSRLGTLTLAGKPRRLVICVSSDGTDLSLRAFSDGTSMGTEAWSDGLTSFSGIDLDLATLLIGCTGSGGSVADQPFASPDNRGFDGSIRFLGYYSGTVSNAVLSSMSEGQAPEDVLPTGANWLIGRDLTDYTESSFYAASWATGDAHGAWLATGDFLPGGDITPARDGAGNTFALDPIVDGQVWGCAPGQTGVSVTLSGTSTGLTGGVEARIRYRNGTPLSDWAPLAGADLAGGGTWSGSITWPLSTDGWCHVEVRDAASQTLLQRSRAYCGVGWVLAMVGQSNIEFPVKATAGGFAPTDPGNLSICFRFRTTSTVSGGAPGSGSLVVDRVTAASPRTNGASAMADELKAQYGNVPVMIFDMMQEGAGVAFLQDDNITDRLWSDAPGSLIDVVGNRVSAFCIEWGVSITEFRVDEDHDALIKGDDSGGLVTWPIGDNYLWSPDFFHTTSAGVALMQGPGFGQVAASVDQDIAWIAFPDEPEFQYTLLQKAYADENPGIVVGTSMNGVELDGGHAVDPIAKDRASRALLIAGLAACGIEPITEPLPVDLTVNGTLDEVTVHIDLPSGGNLQTEWSANGETPPVGQNPVQGIEIHDITGSRLPSRSGFSTAIGDTGTGEAPNRRGTITITKDSGSWERGSLVSVIPGFGMSYRSDYFDFDLWKGWPRESSSAMDGLGLLVPQGRATYAMPVDPEADLGALAWFRVDDGTKFFQERTGASATTPAGEGDPVGTVVVSGPLGGYFTAPSDAARPIRRSYTITMSDVLAHLNNTFHYMRVGETNWYLDFDGVDDQLVYSGGGLVPNQVNYAVGCAVTTDDVSSGRHVMSDVGANLDPDTFVLFQNVNNVLGGFGGPWRVWHAGTVSDPHAISILDGVREFSPILILNSAAGREFVSRQTTTSWSDATAGGAYPTGKTFRIGVAPFAYGDFKGRFHGMFVSGDAFTTTQKRQANVWLGQMLGQNNPYW
ncbi:MAG: hypothetical protein AAF183_11300 [Pseudomonadota bacterium]